MDGVELNRFLQNEYLENPLLDYSGTHGMGSGQEEINKSYEQILTYGRNYEDMIEEEDKRRKDIPTQDSDQVRNFLLDQLPRKEFSRDQWALLEYMVDCLDDTGFFTTPVEEVADKTHRPEDEVGQMLGLLRELEPYGIFAQDLKHCLLKQLEMLGMLAYVDFLVSSEEAGAEKPALSFFARCVEKAGFGKKECLFVGDSLRKDVLGALDAGLQAVWYGPESPAEEREDVLRITDMRQLPEVVSAL